jgi:uncharacterized zinc-type alcohol dehydrogenase-like protein
MVDSRQHCKPCEHGHEQYCGNLATYTYTYNAVDRRDGRPTYWSATSVRLIRP